MARPAATLAVVALLALAGCAGLDPGAGQSSDEPSGEPVYDPPLNETAVLDGHLDAARDDGTYTLVVNRTFGPEAGETNQIRWTVWGDVDSDAYYSLIRQENRVIQTYAFWNGTAYRRSVSGGEAEYREWSERANNATVWLQNGAYRPLYLFEYAFVGTETRDGATVYVYEAPGADALNTSAHRFDYFDDVVVESAHSTLYVREDGLVTHATYSYTFEHAAGTHTATFEASFENLGDTDISPPAWVSTARNRTDDET